MPDARTERLRVAMLMARAREIDNDLGHPFGDRDDVAALLDSDPRDVTLDQAEGLIADLVHVRVYGRGR